MKNNQYLAWTAFALFLFSAGIFLFLVVFAIASNKNSWNPGLLLLLVGAFSFLAAILGLLSFKAPQAKVGGIGGLALLLLVLFVTPVTTESTAIPVPMEGNAPRPAGHTGIPEIDTIIDTFLAGDGQKELQLLQFSRLACTHREGLGGPPKCRAGETEGTQVEAFPILGPEGHHIRRDEMSDWKSLQASGVYAVYRVSENVYSDEYYPAGEHAIVFLVEKDTYMVTAHVTNGKVVRLDYLLSGPSELNLEQAASEILVGPEK